MKGWFAAAILLLFLFGLPFRAYDTAKLLPVRTLQVTSDQDGISLTTETLSAHGESFDLALQALCREASGEVLLDTVEHLVLADASLLSEILSSEQLRPAAQVYFAHELPQTQELSAYLSAHPTKRTLAVLRAEYYYNNVSQGETE